jgi:hypothetical protein
MRERITIDRKGNYTQGVTKRCRLSLLTNSAFVYEPKCGGEEVAGYQPMSTAIHRSSKKLWRSNSIFYPWNYPSAEEIPFSGVVNYIPLRVDETQIGVIELTFLQ